MRKTLTWSISAYSRYPFQKAKFRAIAHPFKVIYINPDSVKAQLRQERKKRTMFPWGSIRDGNWDKEINVRYGDDDIAYKSLYQHFHDGVPWQDTPIVAHYTELLSQQGSTKGGCRSLSEFMEYYPLHIQRLYNDIKQHGLRQPSDPTIDPIYVYIGEDGELIYSGNGNHRLHIAKLLGIRKFPVLVRMRHLRWQMVREAVKSKKAARDLLVKYRNHPDLQDLP